MLLFDKDMNVKNGMHVYLLIVFHAEQRTTPVVFPQYNPKNSTLIITNF